MFELVAYSLGLATLVVVWRRGGVLGHRSHRGAHWWLRGHTSDVSFHPETYYPSATLGCPKVESGDKEGELMLPVCRWFRRMQRLGVILLALLLAYGLLQARLAVAVMATGAELAGLVLAFRYARWRWRRDRACIVQANPLASLLAYPFRLRTGDIADTMVLRDDGSVESVLVPTTFLATEKRVLETSEAIKRQHDVNLMWQLRARPPVLRLSPVKYLPDEVQFASILEHITDHDIKLAPGIFTDMAIPEEEMSSNGNGRGPH